MKLLNLSSWKNGLTSLFSLKIYFILAFVSGAIGVYQKRWITDDAFISFRYAQNFANGLGLVYNAEERVEGFTNFLWTILLSLWMKLGGDPIPFSYAFGMGMYLLTGWVFWKFFTRISPSQKMYSFSIFWFVLAFLSNRHIQIFATSGLETSLFYFLILWGTYLLYTAETHAKTIFSIFVFCLASMTRPDGVLFFGTSFVYLLCREFLSSKENTVSFVQLGKKMLIWFSPVLLVFVPYWWSRYNYYGWFFPNTFYAKSGDSLNFSQGFVYFSLFFRSYWVFCLLPVLLAIAFWNKGKGQKNTQSLLSRQHPFLTLVLFPALLYIFYYTSIGGDFMFGRFYLPVVSFLYLSLFSLGLSLHFSFFQNNLAWFGFFVFLATVGYSNPYQGRDLPIIQGITEESQVYKRQIVEELRAKIVPWRDTFRDEKIRIAIAGSQAIFGYYLEAPYVLEAANGLTDETIAHEKLTQRGSQMGHERPASVEYMRKRGVHLHLMADAVGGSDSKSQRFRVKGFIGDFLIVNYDPSVFEKLGELEGWEGVKR